MDAQVGGNPSYLWRSIVVAKPMTMEGAKWVMGDGRSIKIWDENWLPSTESSKIITSRTLMGRETRVAM